MNTQAHGQGIVGFCEKACNTMYNILIITTFVFIIDVVFILFSTQQNSGTSGKSWFPYQSCLHAYAVLRKNYLVPSISLESSYLCVQGSSVDARKNNGQILLEMLISQLAARKSILVCMGGVIIFF